MLSYYQWVTEKDNLEILGKAHAWKISSFRSWKNWRCGSLDPSIPIPVAPPCGTHWQRRLLSGCDGNWLNPKIRRSLRLTHWQNRRGGSLDPSIPVSVAPPLLIDSAGCSPALNFKVCRSSTLTHWQSSPFGFETRLVAAPSRKAASLASPTVKNKSCIQSPSTARSHQCEVTESKRNYCCQGEYHFISSIHCHELFINLE